MVVGVDARPELKEAPRGKKKEFGGAGKN